MAPPPAPPPPRAPLPRAPSLFKMLGTRTRTAGLRVINAPSARFGDIYYGLLRASWLRVLLIVAVGYLCINAAFGAAFWLVGGVANVHGGYLDCFFFSVHTFGTIGYGSMYPESTGAQWLVSVESLVSLILNAVITGLAFAKFARPTARILWSGSAVIHDRDGLPTLMFRVANERMNHVVEATIRAAVLRSETTKEGEYVRRIVDLPLMRASSPSFILTWTVMHQITPDSPFYGLTMEQYRKTDMDLILTLHGLDETLAQTIHSRHSYSPSEVEYGARFQDIISAREGDRVLDYGLFHVTQPATVNWERLGVTAPSTPQG